MRDLRAELLKRDENVPVEWQPTEGDILVGSVRDACPHETIGDENCAVVVEEERTGLLVLVSLDSPHLAALFELHNPRGRDRIGIKCTSRDPNGISRFTMVIDRADAERLANSPFLSEAVPEDDDGSAATTEEREYITQMLAGAPTEEPDGSREDPINGLLRRQEEELSRQARTLERLESLISPSHTPDPDTTDSHCAQPPSEPSEESRSPRSANVLDSETAQSSQTPRPTRGQTWLGAVAIWIALFLSGAIGAASAVLLKPTLQMWLGW